MKTIRTLMISCAVTLLGALLALPANAQDILIDQPADARLDQPAGFGIGQPVDKSTFLTFSGPVSLPDVSLPPGTYLFRFADPINAPSVLQVLSQDEKTVYAMVDTIPIARPDSLESPVTFKETRADALPQVDAWFYADDPYGCELIYSK